MLITNCRDPPLRDEEAPLGEWLCSSCTLIENTEKELVSNEFTNADQELSANGLLSEWSRAFITGVNPFASMLLPCSEEPDPASATRTATPPPVAVVVDEEETASALPSVANSQPSSATETQASNSCGASSTVLPAAPPPAPGRKRGAHAKSSMSLSAALALSIATPTSSPSSSSQSQPQTSSGRKSAKSRAAPPPAAQPQPQPQPPAPSPTAVTAPTPALQPPRQRGRRRHESKKHGIEYLIDSAFVHVPFAGLRVPITVRKLVSSSPFQLVAYFTRYIYYSFSLFVLSGRPPIRH